MANDVAKKIFPSKTGVDGAAYVAPNGLKIVDMNNLKKTVPQNSAPVNDVAESGRLHYRFDDTQYYTA